MTEQQIQIAVAQIDIWIANNAYWLKIAAISLFVILLLCFGVYMIGRENSK